MNLVAEAERQWVLKAVAPPFAGQAADCGDGRQRLGQHKGTGLCLSSLYRPPFLGDPRSRPGQADKPPKVWEVERGQEMAAPSMCSDPPSARKRCRGRGGLVLTPASSRPLLTLPQAGLEARLPHILLPAVQPNPVLREVPADGGRCGGF